MYYIDIAIIVLVVLSALIGLGKGFTKTIIGFLGGLVTLVVTILITEKVAEYLLAEVDFFKSLAFGQVSIKVGVLRLIPASLSDVSLMAEESILMAELDNTFLKPFAESILSYVKGAAYVQPEMLLSEAVAVIVSHYIFILLTGIALFFLIRILVALLSMGLNAMTQDKKVSALNHFMGFIFGAVRALVFVAVFFLILPIFSGFSFTEPLYNEIDNSTVAKPISEFVTDYSDKYLNKSDNLLYDLLVKLEIISGTERGMGDDEALFYADIVNSTKDLLAVFEEKGSTSDSEIAEKIEQIEQIIADAKAALINSGLPTGYDVAQANASISSINAAAVSTAFDNFTSSSSNKAALMSALDTVISQLAPLTSIG